MRDSIYYIVSVLLALGLTCCQTPPAAEQNTGGLAATAGTWKFSHFGPPTVWNSGFPDPKEFMNAQFKDARIVLDREGKGSMLMAGQAHGIEAELVESTESFVKLRLKGQENGGQPMIYDRMKRTLMLPTNLELPDSTGTIPTYFRLGR